MSEDIEIINQNTRIEKIKNFFNNNYKKLIGLLVSILLLLFSYFGYQEYKKRAKLGIAETYNQITLKDITIEKTIFTFKGILLDPRNGLEIKNAESLIEHKKNVNR